MNHGIAFASTALVGEGVATGVNDLDCSTCHHEPNGQFIGAVFHANTAAVPLQDCVSCHYVTMVDPPTADVRSGTAYQMRHTSAQMPFHTCQPCHASALARATTSTTLASDSWRPGQYHAVLSVQPTRCNDCHASSAPATHGSIAALGDARDCSDCHLFPGTGTRTAPDWLGATTPL
jgi:hypothetical protein